MRLIDADALVEKSFCTAPATMDNPYGGDSVVLVEDIENAPTIDPESLRPQGEWVKSEDDYCGLNIIKCSLCREEWCFEVDDDVETLNYQYCPNCGAKMKGGTP
jgi:hypothetical protein